MEAVSPVTLLAVWTVSHLPVPAEIEVGTITVRVVPRELSPPNNPPAIATNAAAAPTKRHRVRRAVVGDGANGAVGTDPADLVGIHPGQERGQTRQARQLVPAVPAGQQVSVDQPAL